MIAIYRLFIESCYLPIKREYLNTIAIEKWYSIGFMGVTLLDNRQYDKLYRM